MMENLPTDAPSADTIEPVVAGDATSPDPTPVTASDSPQDADSEPDTFSRDYVNKLRDEAAQHRLRAKRTDAANARLLDALIASDGRLLDPEALPLSDDLLDDDGIVDPGKVADAVGSLVERKAYLLKPPAPAPLPQGVREDVPQPLSLLEVARRML